MRDEAVYPNWFVQYAQRYFMAHLGALTGRPGLRFLQIGAYTGDATTWLFDHVLTAPDAVLTDVDTWAGSDEELHEPMDFAEVERIYDQRTASLQASGRLIKVKGTSRSFFEMRPRGDYDFVYVDGAHTAYAVLNDAVAAYPLLRIGGLLAFDDYRWDSGKGRLAEPAPAIDAIGDIYSERLERLPGPPDDLQVWFRKRGSADDLSYEGRTDPSGRRGRRRRPRWGARPAGGGR